MCHEKATPKDRCARAVTLLCSELPRGKVAAKLAEEFGIGVRTAWRDIAKARRVIPTWWSWEEERALVSEHLARLDEVYEKAVKAGSWHAAIRALERQAELMGLNSAQQIAANRDTLRAQLEDLRTSRRGGDDDAGDGSGDAPLVQFNRIRAAYGMRQLTEDEYDALRSGKGSNGHGGNGVSAVH